MKVLLFFVAFALIGFWGYVLIHEYRTTVLVPQMQQNASSGRVSDTSLLTDDPLPVPTLGVVMTIPQGSENAEIQKKGTGSFIPYSEGQPILAGDTVRVLEGQEAVIAIPQLGTIQLEDGASTGFINTLTEPFLVQYSGSLTVSSVDGVISFRSQGVLVAFTNATGSLTSDQTNGITVSIQSGKADVGFLDYEGNTVTSTVQKGEEVTFQDGELIRNE